MKLTKANLLEWKKMLTSEMMKQYGVPNFAEALTDEEWMLHEGDTVQDIIECEVDCWTE